MLTKRYTITIQVIFLLAVFTSFIIFSYLVFLVPQALATTYPITYVDRDLTLDSDVSSSFFISTDNVTLDCDGHKVINPQPDLVYTLGNTVGIALINRTGVTVKDCVIDNFPYGVFVSGGTQNTIESNVISDAPLGGGIRIFNSSNNVIKNNSVNQSKSRPGISLVNSVHNELVGNVISSVFYPGVEIGSSSYNQIHGNSVTASSHYSVVLYSICIGSIAHMPPLVFFLNYCSGGSSNYNTLSTNEIKALEITGRTSLSNLFIGQSERYNQIVANSLSGRSNGSSILLLGNSNSITENTITGNSIGIILSAQNFVFKNNIFSNTLNVFSSTPIELSLNSEGNYWGHNSPPCFYRFGSQNTPYDTNAANVVDNYPFCQKDGWLTPPQMINPTDEGKLKCGVGCYPSHEGIDIDKTLYQRPVKAAAGGTIVKIDSVDDSKAGKWVWISHGDITKLDGTSLEKISTRYLHLDTIDPLIEEGGTISQGTIIGTAGQTGATVPHLHFEVRQGDIPQNLDFHLTTALNPLDFVTYPHPGFSASAFSPVDIAVTDPDGLVVSKTANDLQDSADYFEVDYVGSDIDGEAKDYEVVTINTAKIGDYSIEVVPEAVFSSRDTYTLKVSSSGATLVLAENVLVSAIPQAPYIIRLSKEGIEQIVPVQVRVEPEVINLNNKGVITAFVQFPKGVGVSIEDVDTASIKLEGTSAIAVNKANDVLVVKFSTQSLVTPPGEGVRVKIIGRLLNGKLLEGSDVVRIVKS